MTSDVTYYPRPGVLTDIPTSGHVVLEASAGTGKTYTLEHLVVDLVVQHGARLSEIAAVTFTNKATAELRRRVRDMLRNVAYSTETTPREDAWCLDARARMRIRAELADFSSASIMTIHGFCQSVLRDFAFDHQIPFGADLVDETSLFADSLLHEVRYAPARGVGGWLEAWLYSGGSVDKLIEDAFVVSSRNVELQPMLWPEDVEQLQHMVRQCIFTGEPIPKETKETLRSHVVAVFAGLARAEFDRRRRRDGALTFSDLLEHVHETLMRGGERAESFTRAIRARYRFALIDEFQDTDGLQWDIFRRLFADGTDDHRLFVVGDPKQSIYAFRGADVTMYRSARDEVAGENHDGLVHLSTNYRSSERMVEACNLIFAPGTDDYFTGQNDYSVASTSPNRQTLVDETGADCAPITVMAIETDSPWTLTSGVVKPAFVIAIAESIERVLNGSLRRADGKLVNPSDIYVLTRSNAEAAEIAAAVRERRIPVTLYRQEGLFQSDEARQVFELLRAIAYPFDRSHRRHAYLTDFFAIPLGELELADELEESKYTPRDRLRRWSQRAALGRFEALFEAIVVESGAIRRLLLLDEGERAITNYRHIFEVLTHEARVSGADIQTLVNRLKTWIDGHEKPDSFDVDSQRRETDREAVQVMTVHKSKGLEAEVVYLFGGFSKLNRAPFVINRAEGDTIGFLYKELLRDAGWEQHHDAARREEAERLYYVALTRARSKLFLPYVPRGARYGRDGEYEAVLQRLDNLAVDETVVIREKVELGELESSALPDWSRLKDWEVPTLIEEAPADDGPFGAGRKRRSALVSYSSLKHGTSGLDLVLESTEVEEEDEGPVEDERFTDEPRLPRNATAGSFLHAILEDLDYTTVVGVSLEEWASNSTAQAVIDRRFAEFRYDEIRYRPYTERVLFDTLSAPVDVASGSPIPSLAHLENDAREVRFVYPVGANYAHGFVDLLFEWEGRFYFADWKSDTPHDGFAAAAIQRLVNDRYPVQASVYTVALARLLNIDSREAFEQLFGGFYYFFIRGMRPTHPGHGIFFGRPSWEDFQRWDRTLSEMER